MDVSPHNTGSPVPVVAFIGGIGSGKSSLARWLSARLRVLLIDADAIGHEVLTFPDIQQALVEQFGNACVKQGRVDRSWLAQSVFGTSTAQVRNRQALESIVHPVMKSRMQQIIQQARLEEGLDVILFDAAVVLEAGWTQLCDATVFVDAPDSERLRRVQASRVWSAEDLRNREASQWPLDRKRHAADAVIDNSGTIAAAGEALLEFLETRFPSISRTASGDISSPSRTTPGAAASVKPARF